MFVEFVDRCQQKDRTVTGIVHERGRRGLWEQSQEEKLTEMHTCHVFSARGRVGVPPATHAVGERVRFL